MKLGRWVRASVPGDFDFVAVGENSLDTLAVIPGPWRPGTKQQASRVVECAGGQAATAAVCCARLGWRTRYVGAVGDDAAGNVVTSAVAGEGVDVMVVTRAGVCTRRAVVLVDEATGDRAVLERRDAALDLSPGEVPAGVFTGARVLLVDGSDPGQSIFAARCARAADGRTLVDVDRPFDRIGELLPLLDVIVMPEALAAVLAGVPELGRALASIGRETDAAAVVATLGWRGALGWCRGQEVRAPGRVVDVGRYHRRGRCVSRGFCRGMARPGGHQPGSGGVARRRQPGRQSELPRPGRPGGPAVPA